MMDRQSANSPSIVRNHSLSRLAITAICLLGLACTAVAARPSSPAASASIFEKLVLDRISAFGRGDVQSYMALIGNDFVHIADNGVRRTALQMMPYVSAGASPGNNYVVRDLKWHVYGNLAVVDCEVLLFEAGVQNRQRETDIFAARDGRWIYLLHQETAIQERPAAVAIDPNTLLDFVGEYRQQTGAVDIISARGGQLFGQEALGDEPTPLVPIAPSAFVVEGDPAVTIFERDPQGKVIGYLLHAGNGRLFKAKKIK